MNRALTLLATVFADPRGSASKLDELRARWHEFSPEERAALTPLAKLAAERVKAAPADDPDGYWASLDAAGPPDEADAWTPAATDYDEPPRRRRDEPADRRRDKSRRRYSDDEYDDRRGGRDRQPKEIKVGKYDVGPWLEKGQKYYGVVAPIVTPMIMNYMRKNSKR